ncbi:MAG: serine/threonine protein phosphatase [Deltaproteobacteria bacterium]|jgi:hypothetical protein|nr:serine/threonine protein phosphatase [Deltaproteobacteria bacterium]MBW2531369.1 serine/threonine protein phosphatase [Deltaproteobacteria bacterium]
MLDFSSDPYVAENQMKAIIFTLVAFGYIDSNFDAVEKTFIQQHIQALVDHRATQLLGEQGPGSPQAAEWTKHFFEVLEEMDRSVKHYFAESVGQGETQQQFVLAKLKLGCFEVLKRFDEDNQQAILASIDELIRADGVVHPEEVKFRDEVVNLLQAPIELDDADIEPLEEGALIIDKARTFEPLEADHPLLHASEWDYASDPTIFAEQAEGDMELVARVMGTLAWQRSKGQGRLSDAFDFQAFAGGGYADDQAFLDGHVYVLPSKPEREVEILVIADLHGCYSCLKAALMQSNFFKKVEAHEKDPANNPAMYLVLLGDYIDRGRFSYTGTLRAVMQLFLKWPDRVFMLRGNHEFYVEINGKVLAPVRPSEAMDSISGIARMDVFARYMKLFDELPNMLVFDRTLFVHGGIPRQDTLDEKWKGIHSLNDPEIRFQMMWSDPSEADVIPVDLQKENARFPFGKKQFQRFLADLACKTMVRGHERVDDGFKKNYDDPEGTLLTVFSAGGATNGDLPEKSSYRQVNPMALSMRFKDGVTTLTPFPLDYARYNDPDQNAFFKKKLEG